MIMSENSVWITLLPSVASLGLDVLLQNAATQDLPRMRPTVFANSIAVHQNETYVVGRGTYALTSGCEVDMDGQKVPAGTAPDSKQSREALESWQLLGFPHTHHSLHSLQHIIVASEPASPKFVKAALSNS
jgi:hypothetical protein